MPATQRHHQYISNTEERIESEECFKAAGLIMKACKVFDEEVEPSDSAGSNNITMEMIQIESDEYVEATVNDVKVD